MTRVSFLLIALSSLLLASCQSVSLGGNEEDGGAQSGGGSFSGTGGQAGTGALDTSLGGQGGGTSGTETCGPRTFDADCFGGATIYTCVQRGGEWVWDYRCPEVTDGGPRQVDTQPLVQHPYVSTGAACISYPVSGYRSFPEDPSIQHANGGEPWPQCTRNCNILTEISGANPFGPPDQALPAGSCDDEGATCAMAANAWCPPCANVGGPYNGYTCVCRAHSWHCAVAPIKGANACGMPTCLDPSLATKPNSDCSKTTWTDTQVCACGVCRDICDTDAQCPSGRCKLNQVCGSSQTCQGPGQCWAPCRGLCESGADAGAPDAPAASCPGPNRAERTCRNTASDCIPSTCRCGDDGQWVCTADCRSLPLCAADGGVACAGARIDNTQAATALAQYIRRRIADLNPATTFGVEEKTVPNLWETLQAQLFFGKMYADDGSVWQEAAFLYRACEVTMPTEDLWFGLIDSGVVSGGAFYYSWGWSSGIYRSNLGKVAASGTTLVRTTSPSYFNPSSSPPGLVVSSENGRLVVYRATVHSAKFNEWTNPERMGFLKDFGDRLAVVDETDQELSTTLP